MSMTDNAAPAPTVWRPDIPISRRHDVAPLIGADDIRPVADDLGVWDAWPIQEVGGLPARLSDGTTLWMALGTRRFADPDERHAHARILLLALRDGRWRRLDTAMPDGFSPGSREWSGSAVLDADGATVTLYFTATGHRDEAAPGFLQRLFAATATLVEDAGDYRLADWRDLRPITTSNPEWYMPSDSVDAGVGAIKAFRDPGYLFDPVDGRHYLFFAGSLAGSSSAHNGVIGTCVSSDPAAGWRLLPPLVSADGFNNELERPHVVRHAGLYYLFWSTQRHVFDPACPGGPTGLYGMVASDLAGDWTPLNGDGLVFANPPAAPQQAYSWWVMPDLSVTSFVDRWVGQTDAFAGCFAPFLTVWLDGARAGLNRD